MELEDCKIINDKVALMVGGHIDYIIESREKDACDKSFDELQQRFPVKTLGELRIYTGCSFVRDRKVSWR